MIGDKPDPRWERFSANWTCANCEEPHQGIFDLAFFAPAAWPGEALYEENRELRTEGNFLSEDFCVVGGEHYFVRCVFELPLVGTDGRFGFGVWSTLSRENFDIYVDGFDEGMQGHLGPWFGWFSNRLPGYPDTFGLKVYVQPNDRRHRPKLSLIRESVGHPLADEQRTGITFDRLRELYAIYGHDPLEEPGVPLLRN